MEARLPPPSFAVEWFVTVEGKELTGLQFISDQTLNDFGVDRMGKRIIFDTANLIAHIIMNPDEVSETT